MLPDFKSTKMKIETSILTIFNEKVHESPLLSHVGKKVLFEGRGTSFIDDSGDYVEKNLEKVGKEFSVKPDEILERGVELYIEKFLKASEEFKEEIVKQLLEEVDVATSKSGTKVDASGKLITEFYLDGLRKVQIDFDEEGNPFLPSLAMHPNDVMKHDKKLAEHLKKDPKHMEEYEKELEEIIEIKREEWRDRESNRKLVD